MFQGGMNKIEYRDPNALEPHPRNSNYFNRHDAHTYKNVRASISQQGIQEPLIISPNGTIYSGHLRRKIALDLDLHEVPVRIHEAFATEEEEVVYLIRSNMERRHFTPRERKHFYKILLSHMSADKALSFFLDGINARGKKDPRGGKRAGAGRPPKDKSVLKDKPAEAVAAPPTEKPEAPAPVKAVKPAEAAQEAVSKQPDILAWSEGILRHVGENGRALTLIAQAEDKARVRAALQGIRDRLETILEDPKLIVDHKLEDFIAPKGKSNGTSHP